MQINVRDCDDIFESGCLSGAREKLKRAKLLLWLDFEFCEGFVVFVGRGCTD